MESHLSDGCAERGTPPGDVRSRPSMLTATESSGNWCTSRCAS